MDGPIAEGTTGNLEHVKGRKSSFVIHDVRSGVGFTAESAMPATRLEIQHEVAEEPGGGSRVTQRAVLIGPLARVWGILVGRELKHDMRAAVEAVALTAAEDATAPPPASRSAP
jgi:hypothetical protein